MTLTEADAGKMIDVHAGQAIVVKLKAQMGTGYGWAVVDAPPPLRAHGEPKTESPSKPMPGGEQFQLFHFETSGKGTATLRMAYRRPWEKGVKPAREFHVTIVAK